MLDVIENAQNRWKRQAELARVTLATGTDESTTSRTSCTELSKIVEPILDNAVRPTPPDGSAEITLRIDARSPDALVVSFTNSGDAIPANLAPHVFDAWVSSRDASVAGGLGLWLARETARDLGGDVTLVDDSPHTTTFRVGLPVTTNG